MFSSFRPSSTTFNVSKRPDEKNECKDCKSLEIDNRVLRKQIEELVKKQMELEKTVQSLQALQKCRK